MNTETKICSNCESSFVLAEEDFEFFEKLGVTPPSLCAQCGVQYTMALRNERVLYRRACDKCKKETLSLYHPTADYVVYCHDCWWKDDWDGIDYAINYDPNRSFFEQFKELQRKVPREALIIVNSENCDYGNNVRDAKNCYFSFLISHAENLYYCMWVTDNTHDCVTSRRMLSGGFLAYCIDVDRCNSCSFIKNSSDCDSCYFSFDLRGCSNCIFSSNLRNKSYCIRNKQYSKEDYEIEKKRILDGSYTTLESNLKEYRALQETALHRYANIIKSEDVVGNYVTESSDCIWCFDGVRNQHARGVASILNAKDSMYCYGIGVQPTEFTYGSSVIKGGSNVLFSFNLFGSDDCTWCDSLVSSSHCAGSIGVKRKDYCILNKQYPREEWLALVAEIKQKGEITDFPPKAFSCFGYNETAAHNQYPLTKEEAVKAGYTWQDDIPFTSGKETIQPDSISDNITDVQDSIEKEVLRCVECRRNYRVVKDELALYRRFSLPIPRDCPQCRLQKLHEERLPFKLWHRTCMCDYKRRENSATHTHHPEGECPNEFETSYAPDRKEVIYCEPCYQAEVS